MIDSNLIYSVRNFLANSDSPSLVRQTGIQGLAALCATKTTELEAVLYEPVVCLILQGRKETWLGERYVSLAPGDSLIVSHHLPVVSRIVEATKDVPYVALILSIDMSIIRSLYVEVSEAELESTHANSLGAGAKDDDLVQAMSRLFELVHRPVEAKVITPLLRREIHFRLLIAKHGAMLRQLLHRESAASRVALAITKIRQDYKSAISVPVLASTAGMSVSSFHEHFKSTTATTPLQYQKDLRLMEARRLLVDGIQSVSSAAFEVGYESPTQFSREYSRKFGASPRKDLAADRMIS